jgi:hypothetical protein
MPYAQSSFQDCLTETLGAVTATSTGTLITASATVNTKGAWANLGTPTLDYESVIVSIGASSAAADYLLDIGLTGSDTPIIENLRISALKAAADLFLSYTIPVRFPSGTTIRARCQSSTASATLRMTLFGTSSGMLSAGSFSRCVAVNTTGVTASRGVSIDPGATANTKGAWVQLNSANRTDVVDALMLGIGPNNDVTRTGSATGLIDIGYGVGGVDITTIVSNVLFGWSTTTDSPFPNVIGPFPITMEPSTNLHARAQSTNTAAGDRTIDLTAWYLIA